MTIERIDWIDSYGCSSDWAELTESPAALRCSSVGLVADETDEVVVVCPHWTHPHNVPRQYCGDMTIPKCAIIKRTVLTSDWERR